jgi:hypothetical protein
MFTDTLSWLAAGVFIGVGIGHHIGRRRASVRTQCSTRFAEDAMKKRSVLRHRLAPKVLTEWVVPGSSCAPRPHAGGSSVVVGRRRSAQPLSDDRGSGAGQRCQAGASSGRHEEQVDVGAAQLGTVAEGPSGVGGNQPYP